MPSVFQQQRFNIGAFEFDRRADMLARRLLLSEQYYAENGADNRRISASALGARYGRSIAARTLQSLMLNIIILGAFAAALLLIAAYRFSVKRQTQTFM